RLVEALRAPGLMASTGRLVEALRAPGFGCPYVGFRIQPRLQTVLLVGTIVDMCWSASQIPKLAPPGGL
ncbi:hypothetical protein CYMTET_29778, partial [Cymbomonas tetramitiformis]